jgi:hypothetical protein
MHALLIRLRISTITTSRKDKYLTESTIAANNAAADAGRWTNTLWPAEALRPIKAAEAALRAHTYLKTAPFSDVGDRILPSVKFFDFMETYRELEADRIKKCEEFIMNYDRWVNKALHMRGSLFNMDDYPTALEASRSFSAKMDTKPVPESSHFPSDISALDEIKASLNEQIEEGINNAKRDISMRIIKPLEAFLEKASSDIGTISVTTVKSITEIADIIADLDFDGSYTATINALRALNLDAAELRTDEWALNQAKRSVDDILTKFLP